MPPKDPKAPVTCNWVRSIVTDNTFNEFVKTGYLPKKEIMSYRAPDPTEEKPQPKEGEVIVFTDHMNRGFSPPGSKFFRDACTFLTSDLKTSGPIPCQIFAIFKCSLRCTLEKNPSCYSLESYFI